MLKERDWMNLSLEEAGPTGLHKPLYPGGIWSTNTFGVRNTNSNKFFEATKWLLRTLGFSTLISNLNDNVVQIHCVACFKR